MEGPSDFAHPISREEFRKLGYKMIDAIVEYQDKVESYPVRSEVAPGYLRLRLPESPPEKPETLDSVLKDVQEHILPGLTHWQHPSFFAWFPAHTSSPALFADMLSNALGVIGFSWISSPAATELETIVMDWLARLFDLPAVFRSSSGKGGGVIECTASESCLCAMLAAKARILHQKPNTDPLKLVAYTSDQAHSCVKKACMVAGVHHFRLIPTSAEHAWSLQAAALERQIALDFGEGLIPFFVSATLGTTSSCAVDDIPRVADVARDRGLWLHVDSAYAGVFAALPELRGSFQGLDRADSFCTNLHKSMLVTFDCSCFWVRESLWLRAALSLAEPFQFAGLRHAAEGLDYKDWQVPLGRRFRSLKIWFVLRMYGTEGLRAFLRHIVAMTQGFAKLVETDERFELAAPPAFGLVCFRRKGDDNAASAAFLEAINATGRAFLVHTVLGGKHVLRMAAGSANQQWHHVRNLWDLIVEVADAERGECAKRQAVEDS